MREVKRRGSLFEHRRKGLWFLVILLCGLAPGLRAGNNLRVVSLAPNITEIVFKLGRGHQLVGRTDFGTFPPAAKAVPAVGGYLDLNFEKLIQLKPDLVLMLPNGRRRRQLNALGISVLEVPDETVEDVLNSITAVGKALGAPQRAAVLRQGIEDTLRLVRQKADSLRAHPVGLLIVGRQPGGLQGLYAAGKTSYLGQLWEISGGRHAFPEMDKHYFPVNKEDLLSRPVRAILEFHSAADSGKVSREQIAAIYRPLSLIPAVRQNHIFVFYRQEFLIPGPRITRVAVEFSRIIQSLQDPYP